MVLGQCQYLKYQGTKDLLVLAEDRGQPADLSAKSCSDMLRLIGDKLFYAWHNIVKKDIRIEQGAEPYS
jgi:hypothetical protein